ncbi:MAG: MFS transporter [Pseudomonadota bacterium]
MHLSIRAQLSTMMFLQYFVWGAWWVTLGAYMIRLGFGDIVGRTYAAQGIAAIIAPLIFGAIADRYAPAERMLGALHLTGAVILVFLANVQTDKTVFYVTVLLYLITFMPTLPLANAITLHAIDTPSRTFPAIRMFGTLGWIAAGLVLSFVVADFVLTPDSQFTIEQTAYPIWLAAAAAAALGVFCFFLPATPPRAARSPSGPGVIGALGLDIFQLKASGAFWVFIFCSLLTSIPLAFYYGYTNAFLVDQKIDNAVALQSLGQVSEIGFLLLLPLLLARFSFKTVLLVGMLAWAFRYALFAFGYNDAGAVMPFILLGILLHGVCYDFFFVAGQIYVDEQFPKSARARTQAFLTFVTLGIGTLIGGEISNMVFNLYTDDSITNWRTVWLVPGVMAGVVAIGFGFLFKEKEKH